VRCQSRASKTSGEDIISKGLIWLCIRKHCKLPKKFNGPNWSSRLHFLSTNPLPLFVAAFLHISTVSVVYSSISISFFSVSPPVPAYPLLCFSAVSVGHSRLLFGLFFCFFVLFLLLRLTPEDLRYIGTLFNQCFVWAVSIFYAASVGLNGAAPIWIIQFSAATYAMLSINGFIVLAGNKCLREFLVGLFRKLIGSKVLAKIFKCPKDVRAAESEEVEAQELQERISASADTDSNV